MPNFEVDITFSSPEWDTVTVEDALDSEDAISIALDTFKNLYPEAMDPEVTATREVA